MGGAVAVSLAVSRVLDHKPSAAAWTCLRGPDAAGCRGALLWGAVLVRRMLTGSELIAVVLRDAGLCR